jgi:hypothetical protein
MRIIAICDFIENAGISGVLSIRAPNKVKKCNKPRSVSIKVCVIVIYSQNCPCEHSLRHHSSLSISLVTIAKVYRPLLGAQLELVTTSTVGEPIPSSQVPAFLHFKYIVQLCCFFVFVFICLFLHYFYYFRYRIELQVQIDWSIDDYKTVSRPTNVARVRCSARRWWM